MRNDTDARTGYVPVRVHTGYTGTPGYADSPARYGEVPGAWGSWGALDARGSLCVGWVADDQTNPASLHADDRCTPGAWWAVRTFVPTPGGDGETGEWVKRRADTMARAFHEAGWLVTVAWADVTPARLANFVLPDGTVVQLLDVTDSPAPGYVNVRVVGLPVPPVPLAGGFVGDPGAGVLADIRTPDRYSPGVPFTVTFPRTAYVILTPPCDQCGADAGGACDPLCYADEAHADDDAGRAAERAGRASVQRHTGTGRCFTCAAPAVWEIYGQATDQAGELLDETPVFTCDVHAVAGIRTATHSA